MNALVEKTQAVLEELGSDPKEIARRLIEFGCSGTKWDMLSEFIEERVDGVSVWFSAFTLRVCDRARSVSYPVEVPDAVRSFLALPIETVDEIRRQYVQRLREKAGVGAGPVILMGVGNNGYMKRPRVFDTEVDADGWMEDNKPWNWSFADMRLYQIIDGKMVEVKVYTDHGELEREDD